MPQIKSEVKKKSLNVGLTVLFKITSPEFEMGTSLSRIWKIGRILRIDFVIIYLLHYNFIS